MEFEPGGTRIGHYVLDELVGTGGMGEVYSARDLVLKRRVAIKFVGKAHTEDETFAERLLNEARHAAALDHPCICPVYDAGVDDQGRAYMVMQYVEGETLAVRLERGPLPVRDALTCCARIADALHVAHAHGIIHRDLKPRNIMLTPTGEPKLLDFGIAKVFDPGESITATGATSTLTLTADTQSIVGTPRYMSPEQIERRHIDGRSDLFALGATLYECLTGRPAFDAPDPLASFAKVLHTDPPPPSTVRSGLDARHDEVCTRLLAKDPANRFRSADEVIGALHVLGADKVSFAERVSHGIHRWLDRGKWRRQLVAATAITGVILAIGRTVIDWQNSAPPPAPPEAQRWYEQGTESLREGAYYSAANALEEAVQIHRAYPMAYARLAEARAETDDERAAQQALVRISEYVPNQSRLSRDEQLRLSAIRSLVLRDLDAAVRSYRELADMQKTDAGAWLDLGRAQETAGLLSDARVSYARALELDSQYAAAHLRLAVIEAADGNSEQSLKRLDEAERLYRAAANTEGLAEVQIRRGMVLDGIGQLPQARKSLEQAIATAKAIGNPYQILRAEMVLSGVNASEGRFEDAEAIAAAAVQSALKANLETVAAEGLVDLAATLSFVGRNKEAKAQLARAIDLAEKRGAPRVVARARTQRAGVYLDEQQPTPALADLEPAIAFFAERHYRRLELMALSIASHAYQQLDDIPQAHKRATEVLKVAESVKDEVQVAMASANLAAQATALGSLPEALNYRERAETIHRRQHDVASLPYDLTNRAEVLIRLGRLTAGREALEEVEAGIVKGLRGYAGRQRRVQFLRTLERIIVGDFKRAVAHARAIAYEDSNDSPSVYGPVLLDLAESNLQAGDRRRRTIDVQPPPDTPLALVREWRYWRAAGLLAREDPKNALAAVTTGLQELGDLQNDELEWRLAAVGSIAAGELKDAAQRRVLHERAEKALSRLRINWAEHAQEYEARPDLRTLQADAGLSPLSALRTTP